jgi:GT2 family glycosyltransferase/glycosyltransferase involved in cell wall biosynthesis/2-polyprenyl-3-methyl-5-hydroxy-6-metoxy-1,4-benzoquinol methylase
MGQNKQNTNHKNNLSRREQHPYNENYYETYRAGSYIGPYNRETFGYFFSLIAEKIIKEIHPQKVLEVGCAKGFLVEALRDRKIDVYGMDLSEYAINEVRADIKKFCKVGSIIDPLQQKFDLIVCIEVLEHIAPEFADKAVSNLCAATNDILFSSTPDDEHNEPTHLNVQPPEYWAGLFLKNGFLRDTKFDASFISPQAVRFKKATKSTTEIVSAFEKELWFYRKQFLKQRNEIERLIPIEKGSKEKDEVIHNICTMLGDKDNYIASKEKETRELTGTITNLKAEKDNIIASKEKETRELTGTITNLKAEKDNIIASKEKETRELMGLMADQGVRSFKTIQALSDSLIFQNNNVDKLQVEIDAIKNSVLFKMMRKGASVLDSLFGKKLQTQRNQSQLIKIIYASNKLIKEEGFKFYLSQIGEKLRRREFRILEPTTIPEPPKIAKKVTFDENEIKSIQQNISKLQYTPKISIIMPVYNTDTRWISKAIESVERQFYQNWELCICDDGSTDEKIWPFLQNSAKGNKKIKVIRLEKNSGISKASNTALDLAESEFIGLLDNDDELTQDALYEVVLALNKDKSLDMLYSDEDKIDEAGNLSNTFAKPEWDLGLLFSVMFTGHFSVYRRSLVKELGAFRSEYDFTQDYDLALRVTEKTSKIHHIPKVLYHWRTLLTSAAGPIGKPFTRAVSIAAVQSSLDRRGYKAKVVETPYSNRPRYFLETHPLVSIVITTDNKENTVKCLNSIFSKTSYDNYEVVIVTNSKLGEFIKTSFAPKHQIRIINFDKPFNNSAKLNEGAKGSKGEYLLFLNDDIEILHSDWIEALLEMFQRKEVGAVAGKMLYENNTIQHAGMVTNVRNLVDTLFHQQDKDSRVYFNFVNTIRNVSVMSGACMMVPKKVFDMTNGYDPINTGIIHSDVDFCFKIRELGKLLVYTPFCEVLHYGHGTIGKSPDRKKLERISQSNVYLLKRWSNFLANDPYFTKEMRSLLLYGYQNSTFEIIPGRRNENHSDKKNILLITHDLTQSGAPMVVYNIARYLTKRGCFVTVASPENGPLLEKFKEEGIPVIIDSTLIEDPPCETRKLITSFDLVIASTILSWRYVFICKDNETPLLWIIQESDFGAQQIAAHPEIGLALGLADKVVFSNKITANQYEEFNKNKNFVIIPGGTSGIDSLHEIKKATKTFAVIHAGGFEKRKGQDVLLRAMLQVPAKYSKSFEFYFIGRVVEKDYYLNIREMTRNLPNVHLKNEMILGELHEYYKKADIFVCSSRDESLPLTLLDAMSSRMPIITTKVGGISEFLLNEKNCLMVNSEDSQEIANCLVRLLEDENLRTKISKNAYETFQNNLSEERYGQSIYDLISTSLQNKLVKLGPVPQQS